MELPSGQPGFWKILKGPGGSGWYFLCNCPCGCPYLDTVPIEGPGETARAERQKRNPVFVYWGWDGNLQRPTIEGSFKRNTPCKIHFSLINGVYIHHGDGAPLHPDCWKPS